MFCFQDYLTFFIFIINTIRFYFILCVPTLPISISAFWHLCQKQEAIGLAPSKVVCFFAFLVSTLETGSAGLADSAPSTFVPGNPPTLFEKVLRLRIQSPTFQHL